MNNYQQGSSGPTVMDWSGHGWFSHMSPVLLAYLGPIIVVLVFWSLFWKGLALWHSARRGQPGWFIIVLIINTLGILEIIYLFAIARLHWRDLFSSRSRGK